MENIYKAYIYYRPVASLPIFSATNNKTKEILFEFNMVITPVYIFGTR